MKVFSLVLIGLVFSFSAFAKEKSVTYISCSVNEPVSGGKSVKVTAKFAIKDLESDPKLVAYPGTPDESYETILVSPKEIGPKRTYAILTNLNAQGGDMRVEGSNLRFFGDGDGYQFTDLVIWDYETESDNLEGYIRDYGDAYGDTETFKQFIKCKKYTKSL